MVMQARSAGRPPSPTDLRHRIVEATLLQMAAARSDSEVTIARIVAAVGCTPPTLYHYWESREALLAEAGATGWARFRDSQHVDEAGTATDRVRARGEAYLAFALAQPQLFDVLFLTRRSQPFSTDSLTELIADVAEAMADGSIRAGDPQQMGIALWAAVHGVAALAYANPEFGERGARETLAALTARLLDTRT
jgi:AcrR family transcriptional regulator